MTPGFLVPLILIGGILVAVCVANLALRVAWGRFLLSYSPFAVAIGYLLLAYPARHLNAPYVLVTAIGTLAIAACGLRGSRMLFARFLPIDIDHPLHAAALACTLLFIFNHFAIYLLAGPAPLTSSPLTVTDQLASLALLIGLALFGVGALTRRSLSSSVKRLGFRRPTRYQIFFALGFGSAFQFVSLAAGLVAQVLTPGLAQSVDQNSNTIFGPLLGSLAGVLFLSLSAATGEEMLFRGALQPRLGLLLVAVLFTAFHDQYGFSFILLGIFILALGLGWLRNSMNLWVGIVAHAWYDFLSSLSFDPLIALGIGAVGLALCLLLLNSHSERLFAPQTSNFGWQQI